MIFIDLKPGSCSFGVKLDNLLSRLPEHRGFSSIDEAFKAPIYVVSLDEEKTSHYNTLVLVSEKDKAHNLKNDDYAMVTITTSCTGIVTLRKGTIYVGHAFGGNVAEKDIIDRGTDTFVFYIITHIQEGEDFNQIITGYNTQIMDMITKYGLDTNKVIVMSSSFRKNAGVLSVYGDSYISW
jgi:hypothetical protein